MTKIKELLILADKFETKLAVFAAENGDEAPKSCSADDLKSWLDDEEIAKVRKNGKNDKYLPHNPPNAVASEKIWNKAKKAVKKYWKKYDEPWAVVFQVYKDMGGKTKKKKKS